MARGFHCCPHSFVFVLPNPGLYIVKNMCIYTHISDFVETVYELPSLPDNTACETFLHKSGSVRKCDLIFIIGVPAWR